MSGSPDSSDRARIGMQLTYVVVVTNHGPAATVAALTDRLPDTVLFISATATQGSCVDPPATPSPAISQGD
jgi:uncharacterized repeat protein (TIGR01451 family)